MVLADLMQLWFAFSNGFSGQILFERWMIASYNVLFTALPPIVLGVLEQDYSASTLMAVPELYRSGQRGAAFNTKVFWLNMANTVYHSLLAYLFVRGAVGDGIVRSNGTVTGLWFLGVLVYSTVVTIVTLRAALLTTHWTIFSHIAIWGELVIWFVFTLVYFNMWGWYGLGDIAHEVYGIAWQMYSSGVFYMAAILVPVVALYRDFLWEVVRFNFFRSYADHVRLCERRGDVAAQLGRLASPAPEDLEIDGLQSFEHRGYAFSQNENSDSITQADVIRKYDTNVQKPTGE